MNIQIEGRNISIKRVNQEDYISLTDIAKAQSNREPSEAIRSWLRNGSTILFLEVWEKINNPNFKPGDMDGFKNDSLRNSIDISPKRYIEIAGGIGIVSKSGRYGGTFAHRYIAYNFAMWLEPAFQLLLITEFEKLKAEEANRLNQDWNYSRFLSKVNYSLHTETIKQHLLPKTGKQHDPHLFANEADMLNAAVFGITAREYREQFPDAKGNLRDAASIQQLTVLANIESMNAYLIEAGASIEARFGALCKEAARQLTIFSEDRRLIE